MEIKVKDSLLTYMGIFIFLMAMYSAGTLSAITISWTYTFLILLSAIAAGILKNSDELEMTVRQASPITVAWLLITIVCFSASLIGKSYSSLGFYAASLLILVLFRTVKPELLYKSLGVMRVAGIIFAIGCYWQMLFPGQYLTYLFPLFRDKYHDSIMRQFVFHHMSTGFTGQTAVAAEFIILGLMAAVYLYAQRTQQKSKIIPVLEIMFLIGGVLLTGKRSPILNLGAAFVLVDLITTKSKKMFGRVSMLSVSLVVVIVGAFYIAPMVSDSRNTIIRLIESFNANDMEEISNGRFALYSIAVSAFQNNPVFGIGWDVYKLRTGFTGAHNIYLQLLCEAGILGFSVVSSMMAYMFVKTIRLLKSAIRTDDYMTVTLLKCSVFIQTYILVYGLLGNPIYDQNYLLMYVFGLLISSNMWFLLKAGT